MNKIDDIMIIGDKGIVIQYHITQSGYITKTAGNIDLVFDYGAIRKAFDIPEEPFSPFNNTRITLGIDFVSTNNSINRVYDVKMPTLTEYNSFSYEDINNNLSLYDDYSMYGVEETEEDDGSLKIYVNDFRNYTEIEPQFIDDILYLPAAEFIEGVFYGYIQEEQDSDDIYLYVRNSIIRFRADDTIVHTKDGTYELKYPPVYINDVLCVPVETFSEMLGYDIEWNPETLTLNITFNYNI